MHIQVNDTWSIGSDKYCYIVRRHWINKKDQPARTDEAFFQNLSGCCNYIVQRALRDSGAEGAQDAGNSWKRL